MTSALNGSSAMRRSEGSDVIEIRDGITFNFYMGLPHMYIYIETEKSTSVGLTQTCPIKIYYLLNETESDINITQLWSHIQFTYM